MALEPVAKERYMEKLRLLSMSEKDDPYASSNEMKFGAIARSLAGQYFCTATLSSSSVSTALTSTVTLHITRTVHPGLDIVGNKVII